MHRDVKPRNVLINRQTRNRRMGPTTKATTNIHAAISGNKHQDDGDDNNGQHQRQQSQLQLQHMLQPLMLIDLGLADFYFPNTKYNVRVASRHYKSPELLLGYELYDYAIDMWSVGCILAGLLMRREPFFRGYVSCRMVSYGMHVGMICSSV